MSITLQKLIIFSLFIFTLCPHFVASTRENLRESSQRVIFPGTSDEDHSDFSDGSDSELIQMVTFSRHGVSTASKFLYNSEYAPYNVKVNRHGMEQLTPLGEAQCWSIGKDLALKYPGFMDDVVENKDYLMNAVRLQKNTKCSHFIWYGLSQYTPYVGIFSDDGVVKEAFMRKANCFNCTSDSQFPYSDSQTTATEHGNYVNLPENMKHFPSEFIDLDEDCVSTGMFLDDEDVDPLPEMDVHILKEISPVFADEFNNYNAVFYLFKHLYHNLPLEHGLEKISKIYLNRALAIKDGLEPGFLQEVLNVHENKWTMVALYARSLITDLRSHLLDQDYSYVSYNAHDNNILSLLAFFIGANGDLTNYLPHFGSTIEVLIYYSPSRDVKFVEIKWNGLAMPIRDCEGECEFEQFIGLLETYMELGGDLKEWCAP